MRRALILDDRRLHSAGRDATALPPDRTPENPKAVGIIYISHRLEEIRQIADRIVVMRDGAKVQEFDSGDVPIRSIVVGLWSVARWSACSRRFRRPADHVHAGGEGPCLAARQLPRHQFLPSARARFSALPGSWRWPYGTCARADRLPTRFRGRSGPRGKTVTPRSPADAIRNGMVLGAGDRKLQGVVLDHPIAENIGYANLKEISAGGFISSPKLHQFADRYISKFGVKAAAVRMPRAFGRNQQKSCWPKWLARKPRVSAGRADARDRMSARALRSTIRSWTSRAKALP